MCLRCGGGRGGIFTRVVARVDPFRVPLCRLKKTLQTQLLPSRKHPHSTKQSNYTPRTTFRFFPSPSPSPKHPPPRERKSKANFPGARRKGGGGAKYPSRKAAGRDGYPANPFFQNWPYAFAEERERVGSSVVQLYQEENAKVGKERPRAYFPCILLEEGFFIATLPVIIIMPVHLTIE